MKKARIWKKENNKIKVYNFSYNKIIFKENYVILIWKRIEIVKNFENIICETDDFSDLEEIVK